MKCTEITKSGQKCGVFALSGEDKCIFHSDSKRARKARKLSKVLTKEDMILELQRQMRKVKKSDADPLEKSREIRMIFAQIAELMGEKPPDEEEPEGGETFDEKVKKCIEEKKSSR